MAPVSRDNILQLLKTRGPMVPNDIKKIIGGDTIILGAMLAELSARKLVKITHVKRGGSPFYYVPVDIASLETCFQYLSEQEQSLIEFLKREKVVQDNQLEVYHRALLRQLKDFAKEFKANTTQGEILFWRYFLVSDDEAVDILNARHAPKEPEPTPQQTIHEVVNVSENLQNSISADDSFSHIKEPIIEEIDEVQEELQTTPVLEEEKPVFVVTKEDVESSREQDSEQELKIKEQKKQEQEIQKEKQQEQRILHENEREQDDFQEALIITEPALEETPFYLHILKFFDEHDIKMLKEEQLSKGKEYEFILRVPTAVGDITMLARAKSKKRLNESDVAPALLRAKNKNMFCLFLTQGDFTKKSQELMTKEYTGLIQKQLADIDE
jgi:septum formation inhibitor MinC